MKICIYCGQELPSDAIWCKRCKEYKGVENSQPTEDAMAKKGRKEPGWGIEWHKGNVANSKKYYKEKLDELVKLSAEISRHKDDIIKLELQIMRAEREGRDGFDEEKYKPAEKPIGYTITL